MAPIDSSPSESTSTTGPWISARVGFALAVLGLFATCLYLAWGFTVDDALISARVAHHLAAGLGYRFNPNGELSDAVTPLGWAPLLALLSSSGVWSGLIAARWLGLVCSVATALLLSRLCDGPLRLRRLFTLLPLAVCLPFGAWSVSGMETPLITLLCTATLLPQRFAVGFGSLAAGLRPEMIPWCITWALLRPASSPRKRLFALVLTLAGPAFVVMIRLLVFGHPAPLAVFAKPSTGLHGLQYAFGGLQLLGLPLLWLSWVGFKAGGDTTSGKPYRAAAAACGVHVLALVAAGGDWMALFRLFVPIIPAILWVAVEVNLRPPLWSASLRVLSATVVCVVLLTAKGEAARGVWAQRASLIDQAQPYLQGAQRIATLDVGWVGAASSADLVDLAGVTDLSIALLSGGHTSKQLPTDLLLRKDVDALVLLTAATFSLEGAPDWRLIPFARHVENRLSRLDGSEAFVPVATVGLRGTAQRYWILRRSDAAVAANR